MTPEEAIKIIEVARAEVEWEYPMDYAAAFDKAIEALKQEPCEDAISRRAVIDVIKRWLKCSDYNEAELHIMRAIQSVLYDSPSVKSQEPKTGHWIPVSEMLPEEREWIGTKRFGTTKSDEVYVTFECPDGNRFTEHLAFQNGRIPPYKQREIDAFSKGAVPIAWMPLPEPYKAESEEV